LIKDLVVNLAQVPSKSIMMEIVVVDVPVGFGMLLSKSWGAKLGGTFQLDLSYATILYLEDRLTDCIEKLIFLYNK
jgi:hypothetical protein